MAMRTNIAVEPLAKLVSLARVIGFEDVESVLYFFDKPHKWQAEFDKWNELDQPTSEADQAWEDWQAYLNRDTSSE